MQKKITAIAAFFILICTSQSFADSYSPIVFRQSKLTIMSQRLVEVEEDNTVKDDEKKPQKVEEEKKQEIKKKENISDSTKKSKKTIIQNVAYPFKVNIRQQRRKEQEGLQHQVNIKPNRGILIQQEPTTNTILKYSDIYKNVDIVMIRPTGVIEAIIPESIPVNIVEDITTEHKVSAVLYLHSGICKELGITPGNYVKNEIFQPKTNILR